MLDDRLGGPSRSSPSGPPALRLVNVGKRFRAVTALAAVNLEVPTGTCLGLLGPNGAGKSTLIGAVAGLVRPTSGQIFVFGDRAETRSARAAVGFAKQNNALDPDSTVRQQLVRHGRLFGMKRAVARERAEEVIGQFGLTDLCGKLPTKLSGGELRRVVLARAVLHDPRLLIVDEPTAGVDGEWRAALQGQIRRMMDAGTTVVLATHYLDDAAALCDLVAFLKAGRVVAQGAVTDLYEHHGVDTLQALNARIVEEDR
jgi:ABC-2 type transport system ATP-binding protein